MGVTIERFEVAEIIKAAENGITNPYLCRMTDDRTFYLKGRQATSKGLISEVLAAHLGKAFGLPVPNFALARVPPTLLELNSSAASALGQGWCFASQTHEQIVEVSLPSLDRLPREFCQRLFLFDYWIRNEDRTGTEHGGNPNVFLDLGTQAPIVLDHNLAFDPSFRFENNRQLHICASAWYQPSVDMLFPLAAKGDMAAALNALDGLVDDLPEAWLEVEPGHYDAALATLSLFDTDQFWDVLR